MFSNLNKKTSLIIGTVLLVAAVVAGLMIAIYWTSIEDVSVDVETAPIDNPIPFSQEYYSFLLVTAGTSREAVEAVLMSHNISILKSFPLTRLAINNTGIDGRSSSSTDLYLVDWQPGEENWTQLARQIENETVSMRGELTFTRGHAFDNSDDGYAIGSRYVPIQRMSSDNNTERIAILDIKTKTLRNLDFGSSEARMTLKLLPAHESFIVFDSESERLWVVEAATGAVLVTRDFNVKRSDEPLEFRVIYTSLMDGIVFSISRAKFNETDLSEFYRMDLDTHTITHIGSISDYRFPQAWRLDGLLYLASSAPKDCAFYPYLNYINPDNWSIYTVDSTTRALFARETVYQMSPNGGLAVVGYAHTPPVEELGMCAGDRTGVLELQQREVAPRTIETATRDYLLRPDGWTSDNSGLYYARVYTAPNGSIARSECVLYDITSGTAVVQSGDKSCEEARYRRMDGDMLRVTLTSHVERHWILNGDTLTQQFKTSLLFASTTLEEVITAEGQYPRYYYGSAALPVR